MCGGGRLKARAVILHYDAGYRILKRFVELGQVLDARLNDLLAPLVNFVFLILNPGVAFHDQFHGLLCNLLHFFR